MTVVQILVIIGTALWLSLMEMTLLVVVWPDALRLMRPLILPPGWTMIITKVKASYHRPGEQGLVVMAYGPSEGPGNGRNVRTRALLALWAFLFLDSLILCTVLVLVFWVRVGAFPPDSRTFVADSHSLARLPILKYSLLPQQTNKVTGLNPLFVAW